MRLGTRLTLAFLAVALIPAGVILTVTWFTVEERFQEEFEGRLVALTEGLTDEVKQVGTRLQAKVKTLVESEPVERILVDMVRGGLDRRALIPVAFEWMTARELDLLTMLDAEGVVLSSGQLRARFGSKDNASLMLAEQHRSKPILLEMQISRNGRIQDALAVMVAETRRFNDAKIHLVGGVLIDDRFVSHLEKLSGARILIVDETGRAIASSGSSQDWIESTGMTLRRVALVTDAPAGLRATLVAGISRNKLLAAQWRILMVAIMSAIGGVIFSWLLGLLLSRRMIRPIDGLVRGARLVAEGKLSHQVQASPGTEMGELVDTFNRMVVDLASARNQLIRAERVAAWREIARRIAHEIKNPLSPIQVSIETMRKAYLAEHPDFPEIFDESTTAILEEVGALKKIVTEFSDFARMPKPSLVEQDLRPIAESTMNLYRSKLREGAELIFEVEDGMQPARVDREQVARVMANLLSNAIWAIEQSGGICFRLGHVGERVFFSIEDEGRGMEQDVIDRVFTPYFTTRRDGTGLGLAITQRIVEDHEGSIEIESRIGSGTKVTVWLPSASESTAR
ncbi:MAG: HAMP domain-containing protein [Deltaproteobacteria bacterium]|nr:HAMP domain-containing protein [Deltaproteobacteria bacterium]